MCVTLCIYILQNKIYSAAFISVRYEAIEALKC